MIWLKQRFPLRLDSGQIIKQERSMNSLIQRTTLMTRSEVAEVLRLKETTIKAKTAKGEIPCVKMGRAVRYRPEDIFNYIANNMRSKDICVDTHSGL